MFSNLIGNAHRPRRPEKPVTIDGAWKVPRFRSRFTTRGRPFRRSFSPSLFNPFRRGERESRTAKTAGLGLGLYISHEIVAGSRRDDRLSIQLDRQERRFE